MHRRDLLTSGLLAARAPWLHSRALPLAVIVFLMTAFGCALGEWERPIGRHGYQLIDPSGGLVVGRPGGLLVTPGEYKVHRVIEDPDWLLLELRSPDGFAPLPPSWMVVNMIAGVESQYETEHEARAALPAHLRSQALRIPSPGGVFGFIGAATKATCVALPLIGCLAFIGWLVRRHRQRQFVPRNRSPLPNDDPA